jgi:hypothetical protein
MIPSRIPKEFLGFSTIGRCSAKKFKHFQIQDLGIQRPAFLPPGVGTIPQSSTFPTSGWDCSLVEFNYSTARRHMPADLAIKLNVLAIGIAFAFVGAILFGAF